MKLFAFFVALVISVSAAPAYAEEGTSVNADVSVSSDVRVRPTTTPEGRPYVAPQSIDTRENVRDKVEDRSDTVLERTDQGLHLGLVMRVRTETSRVAILLQAHIKRLSLFVERLTAFAERLEANGVDATEGRAHLRAASAELDLAQADLDEFRAEAGANASLEAGATPQVLKDRYHQARALMKSAREHIRKAFDEIRAAVRSLRAAAEEHGGVGLGAEDRDG